jgi:hypothetical protein
MTAVPHAATVLVTCSTCDAHRTIPASDVQLDVHADYATVEYSCPTCGRWGSRAVSDTPLALLLRAGVTVLHDQPHEYGTGAE